MAHKTSIRHCLAPSILVALLTTFPASAQTPAAADGADTTSAAMGKQSFRSYCASCHGAEARGDGSVAEHLKVPPTDLTQISQRNNGEFPFEDVFQSIDGRKPARAHGNRDMPVWGDAFKMTRDEPDEAGVNDRINDLVHFIKSIQEE